MKIEITLVVDIGPDSNPDEVLTGVEADIEFDGYAVESKKFREIEE